MTMFSSIKVSAFSRLLCKYIVFEHDKNYANEKLPSAKTRPGAVGDWIARARNTDWRPPAKDENLYRQQFKTWYTALQPEWREFEDSEEYRWIRAGGEEKQDWSDLSRSG
ncbi:hypothetical protein K435DRAFT_880994 [Dendrothele bispora CBS 962.96]|uniref:Uncharacterized protein n=1 Tax=Dendrothele bispora (strain CBS 962.96) TaxID=1314807 RepID=A0A4S8KIR9_DENBC|nr:hypothetical protein K435DRAFT_880994 [Dendrothele bispora CBS 962.96]